MNAAEIEQIREHCSQFRAAAERCAFELLTDDTGSLSASDFIVDMLGVYLKEALGIDCEYIGGRRNGRGHAWLECGRLVIDITANRLDDSAPKIVVEERPPFHQQFDVLTREQPSFNKHASADTRAKLARDYQLLLADIKYHREKHS